MKKSVISVYLLIIIALGACTTTPREVETSIPVELVSPSITPSPSKVSYTPTVLVIATDEPSNPVKQALISYTVYSDGGDELRDYCLGGVGHPIFTLYDDGQLILLKNGQFSEAWLTSGEIESLFSEIDSTRIFNVTESSGWAVLIINDNSYNFSPSDYPEGAIQETMNILNQLHLENMVSYIPESLVLWIYPIRSLQSVEESLPKPVPEIQNWSTGLPHLSDFGEGFISISGDNLPKVMAQYDGFPDYKIFKDGSSLYLTSICAHSP